MQTKKELRKEILAIRDKLTKNEIVERSKQICGKIIDLDEYKNADKVCIYMPIKSEVDVLCLLDDIRSDGKCAYIPKVISEDTEEIIPHMEFYKYEGDEKMVIGAYGIREPEGKAENILKADNKTLILMPGAVFSLSCDRIGYGGGYYDTFLEKHGEVMRLAVAYDFQIVDSLPKEVHDISPQIIVTEKRCIYKDFT